MIKFVNTYTVEELRKVRADSYRLYLVASDLVKALEIVAAGGGDIRCSWKIAAGVVGKGTRRDYLEYCQLRYDNLVRPVENVEGV